MKFLFTLIFTAASFFCNAQTGTANQFSNLEKDEYKIQYPDNWSIDTSGKAGAEIFIFSPKEDDSDKFRENVNLLIQDLSGQNIDLDKYASISENQVREMPVDSKIYESQKIRTGKTEYHKIIYEMSQQGYNLKIEQYYFIKNEKAYVLTLTTELAKFIAFKNTGEQILNSFVLK